MAPILKLELTFLGTFDVHIDGQPANNFRSIKAQALLCYLAVSGRVHNRSALSGLLWGDTPEEQARASLRQTLSNLIELCPTCLTITRQSIAFDRSASYTVDAGRFEAAAARLVAAPGLVELHSELALYGGDFLDGFYVRNAPDFETWMLGVRARYRELALQAFDAVALYWMERGDMAQAIFYNRRLLEIEPWHEDAHRHLMQLLAQTGQRAAALEQYRLCQQLLADELGVEPDEATTQLYMRIRAGDFAKEAGSRFIVPGSSEGREGDSQERALLHQLGFQPPPVLPLSKEPDSEPEHETALAPIELMNQPLPAFLVDQVGVSESMSTKFVARERELAQLEAFLASTVRGQGQVVFLTGEAGAGKSTLVQEFIRRAQQTHPALVVALGICKAYAGIDDPYLPFREVLGLLSGDIEDSYASGLITRENAGRLWSLIPTTSQILVEHGLDLVGPFVPGRALLSRAARFAGGHSWWLARLQELVTRPNRSELERGHLFSQFTDVLQEVASQRPIVLALEDLHWADAYSISLLFHLGRSIGGSRILILGTYRTEDIALGRNGERHPLEEVVNELKRQHGEIHVQLNQVSEVAGRQFVDDLLDTEPNQLDADFRQTLYKQTGGHPLFTVELLRDLQEREVLIQDPAGRWKMARAVDWKSLPAKVAGVIENRIGRLEEDARAILAVASLEGEEFTAEIVAQVQGIDTRVLLRILAQLEKRHRLVRSQGELSVAGRYLSRYRFVHALFQQHLYDELSTGERRLLHGEIAAVLEQFYGESTDEISVQLARHYAEAGVREKAATYLVRAGDRAHQLSANQEALRYYQQALALVKDEEAHHTILERCAKVRLELFQGKEAVDDYKQLLSVARKSANREQEMNFLLGLVDAYYLLALDDQETDAALQYRDLFAAAETLARELGNKRARIRSLLSAGWLIAFWPEARELAVTKAREAYALSLELGDAELQLECKLAMVYVVKELEQAELGDSVVEELQRRRDLVRLNQAYFFLMWTHYFLGNFVRSVGFCDAGIDVAAKLDVPPIMYPTLKAFALLALGRYEEARVALQLEIADDGHPFGRAFKDMGLGLYFYEVAAYPQAVTMFEQVSMQASRLKRSWLDEWAQLMLVYSLIRSARPGDSDWQRASQQMNGTDMERLKGLSHSQMIASQLQAEMALAEGRLGEALLKSTEAGATLVTQGLKLTLVPALELQARVLLQLQRPADALTIAQEAFNIASAIEYLSMVWRVCVTQAQALEILGQTEAAITAWQTAAATIRKLSHTITDAELQQHFLGDPLVVLILARSKSPISS